MKHTILILAFLIGTVPAFAQNLIEIGKGYSSTSVNTTIFRNSSLATFNNYQYTAYYDGDGYLVVGKRLLGTNRWELLRSILQRKCGRCP